MALFPLIWCRSDRSRPANIISHRAHPDPGSGSGTLKEADHTIRITLGSRIGFVVLVGLVGGVFGGLAWRGATYLLALQAVPMAAVPWIGFTHVLFVGLVVRRPGAIAISAAITAVVASITYPLAGALLPRIGISFEPDFLMATVGEFLVKLVVVTVVGELTGLTLWSRPTAVGRDLLISAAAVAASLTRSAATTLHAMLTVPVPILAQVVVGPVLAVLFAVLAARPVRDLPRRRDALRSAKIEVTVAPTSDGQSSDAGVPGTGDAHPSATASLVLGILGLVLFAPLAPVAWAMAARGKREATLQPGRYRTSGSLQAGYVLGVIGTVVLALVVLGIVAVFAFRLQ